MELFGYFLLILAGLLTGFAGTEVRHRHYGLALVFGIVAGMTGVLGYAILAFTL